jgi:hypothetical protein
MMAAVRSGNAEFEEFLAWEVERLCLDSTPCFRAASATLGADARASLGRMLATPLFKEKKELDRAQCLAQKPRRPSPK